MRSQVVVLLALGSMVVSDGSALGQRGSRRREGNAGLYGWLFSLEAGKAQARRTGKPLMVVIRCVP